MARAMTVLLTILLAGIASGAQAPPPTTDPCAPQAAPAGGIDPATALQLLDRIQTVLDEAVKGESPASVTPVGTSGTKGTKAADGKIKIDRSLVDEVRAELAQV